MYGVDVASKRLDSLDKRCLSRIAELIEQGTAPRVLELGCGSGGFSVAAAAAGAQVVAVDIADYQAAIAARFTAAAVPTNSVRFIEGALEDVLAQFSPDEFTLVVMQRTLHYLPYQTALQALRDVRRCVTGALYVSVTGVETAMGEYYPFQRAPLEERFAPLDLAGQRLFFMTEPVCLYQAAELQQVLTDAGWSVVWSHTTAFGNHQIIAE